VIGSRQAMLKADLAQFPTSTPHRAPAELSNGQEAHLAALSTLQLNHPHTSNHSARADTPQTSPSDTQIKQCMHGMQRMHAHFFSAIL